jgi:hypothetical protein
MRIVSAAIQERNSKKVHTGTRHVDIIRLVIMAGMMEEFDEGFLTSEGTFVDRYEAARIALESGQIKRPTEKLRSQDLWPN